CRGPSGHRAPPPACAARRRSPRAPQPSPTAMQAPALRYGIPVWGFAIMWLLLAATITLRTARRNLPFSLSWWSFTFPVGTLVTGTSQLALHPRQLPHLGKRQPLHAADRRVAHHCHTHRPRLSPRPAVPTHPHTRRPVRTGSVLRVAYQPTPAFTPRWEPRPSRRKPPIARKAGRHAPAFARVRGPVRRLGARLLRTTGGRMTWLG